MALRNCSPASSSMSSSDLAFIRTTTLSVCPLLSWADSDGVSSAADSSDRMNVFRRDICKDYSSRNFPAQPLRLNSQSLNIGSMTM